MMMVALQNVQHIFIRVADSPWFQSASVRDVKLDTAVPSLFPSSVPEAGGVERCECSKEYNGTSCQDPSRGYYRWRKPDFIKSENIVDFVGISRPCQCHNHAQYCDKESGSCINCGGNTMGMHCDICKPGYYGDPRLGPCKPCACPTLERNYASTCHAGSYSSDYVCNCKQGYAGKRCNTCDYGFYGDPMTADGQCLPCNCNPYGSTSDMCDKDTGQCPCKRGTSGRSCHICSRFPPMIMTEYGCQPCNDGCAGALLEDLEYQGKLLREANITGILPAPWGRLSHIRQQSMYLYTRLDILRNMEAILNGQYFDFDLDPFANEILSKAESTLIEAEELIPKADKKIGDANNAKLMVLKLRDEIDKIVSMLQSYAFEDPSGSVGIDYAVKEAERILAILQKVSLSSQHQEASAELKLCQDLLARIKAMLLEHPSMAQLRPKADTLFQRLDDLKKHLDNVRRVLFSVKSTSKENTETLSIIQRALKDIAGIESLIRDTHASSEATLLKARGYLKEAALYFSELVTLSGSLMDSYGKCEKREEIFSRLLPKYQTQYVLPAQEHARTLQATGQRLANQFNATKEFSLNAMIAAEVYNDIVLKITKAEEAAKAAKKAADVAHQRVFSDPDQSPVKMASKSLQISQQLLQEARQLVNRLDQLKRELSAEKKKMEHIKKTLSRVSEEVSTINALLDQQDNAGLEERGRQIYAKGEEGLQIAFNALDKAMNVSHWLDKLKVEISSSLAGKTANIIENEHKLEMIKITVNKIQQDLKTVNITRTVVSRKCGFVGSQLKSLREKIERARKAAAAIRRVSMKDVSGSCSRVYSTPTAPSLVTNVDMTYSFSKEHRNSLLFYMPPSPNKNDFMSLEMVDRKIRFAWNVGDSVKEMFSDALAPNDRGMQSDSKWYNIIASRIGGSGKLSVQPVTITEDPVPRIAERSDGQSLVLDSAPGGEIWIGGGPKAHLENLNTTNFVGSVHEMFVNGEKVGLWSFKEQIQLCTGFIEGSGQYILLALVGGRVVCDIRFGEDMKITMKSNQLYNTGVWTLVEIGRALQGGTEKANFVVDTEPVQKKEMRARPGYELNFGEEAKIYIGGVPPDFPRAAWPSIRFDSYEGCIMAPIMTQDGTLNPMEGTYFGIRTPCSEADPAAVSFDNGQDDAQATAKIVRTKNGNKKNTKKQSQFLGFSFRGSLENSFLLEAASLRGKKTSAVLYLVGKRLNCTITTLSGSVYDFYTHSAAPLAAWATHNLAIRWSKKKLAVFLNETEVEFAGGRKTAISAQDVTGFDDELDVVVVGSPLKSKTQGIGRFHGCIHDIVFRDQNFAVKENTVKQQPGCGRDKVLTFDKSSAKNAILGTCVGPPRLGDGSNFCGVGDTWRRDPLSLPDASDEPVTGSSISRRNSRDSGSSDPTSSFCAPKTVSVLEFAASFGDSGNVSWIEIPGFGSQISRANGGDSRAFLLSLQFRTNATNGLLFHSLSEEGHILAIYLRDGQVQAVINHGGKSKKVVKLRSRAFVADGRWHEVSVERKHKDARLYLGSTQMDNKKVAKGFKFGSSIFLGSVADGSKKFSPIVYQPYVGCITAVALNKVRRDLGAAKLTNILNCFIDAEPGAFFAESLASLSRGLDIELEMKSTEKQAVLLTVGSMQGFGPGVQLSFHDNEVILRVKPVSGKHKILKYQMSGLESICNYSWHKIRVRVGGSRLSLQVDVAPEIVENLSSVLDFGVSNVRPDIFIGGSPEDDEPTFKGCIKGFQLSGASVGWDSMKVLRNVRISGCPAFTGSELKHLRCFEKNYFAVLFVFHLKTFQKFRILQKEKTHDYVPVRNLVVRVDNDPVAHFDAWVVFHFRSQGIHDPGNLEPRKQSPFPEPKDARSAVVAGRPSDLGIPTTGKFFGAGLSISCSTAGFRADYQSMNAEQQAMNRIDPSDIPENGIYFLETSGLPMLSPKQLCAVSTSNPGNKAPSRNPRMQDPLSLLDVFLANSGDDDKDDESVFSNLRNVKGLVGTLKEYVQEQLTQLAS
ncbi:unnamed protein product [Notodromas monacha]|uniref:Laminin subunit alpha-2 n=2 Tax=Notodromas monacha TaxID=399045 RepID=A0A7R9BN04_9CRUS|nr:unnamed protein product [Notodromas monacha]CAG0918509.1 unnamed protein product [Notodromas monacha]